MERKIDIYSKLNKKNRMGFVPLKCPVSYMQFMNLYHSIKPTHDNIVTQITKFREEFYECMAEKYDTNEFREELLDHITACVNLFHSFEALDNNNKEIYSRHNKKLNIRFQNGYKWI